MINNVVLMGKIDSDIKLYNVDIQGEESMPVTEFSLLVGRKGNVNKLDRLNITTRNNTAYSCKRNLAKGMVCIVEASLRNRTDVDVEIIAHAVYSPTKNIGGVNHEVSRL